MIRNQYFRFVAGIAGLAAGLAAPTSALAHAIDHTRPETHAHHVVPGNGHGYTAADHGHSEPDLTAVPHEGGDHPHALLDAALTARLDCELGPAADVGPVMVEHGCTLLVVKPAARVAAVPIQKPPGPPPPSRAPPLS